MSSTYLDYYRKPGFWAPDQNNNTPIKTLRINFVVFQDDLGNGAMADTPFNRSELQRLADSIAFRFANSGPKTYPSTCPPPPINFIVDTKIRIELNEVLFFQNTDIWSGDDGASTALQYVHTMAPESKNCFNIILVDNIQIAGAWGHYINNAVTGHDCIRSQKKLDEFNSPL